MRSFRGQFTAPRVERTGPVRFRIGGLSADYLGEVIVRAAGYGAASSQLMFDLPQSGQRQVRETFLMHRTVRVRGRVVKASDHSAAAGMTVSVGVDNLRAMKSAPVVTGADGRFSVEAPGAGGRYATVTIADGSEPVATRTLAVPDEPVVLGDMKHRWETRADARGAFVFRDIPADIRFVVAALELPSRGLSRRIDSLEGMENNEVVFRLGSVTLRGRVLHNGKPLACQISASPDGESNGLELRTRTDEQGSFVLPDLFPGRWSVGLFPTHPSFHSSSQALDVPDQEEVGHVFHLDQSTGRIHGTVHAPDGAPAPRVNVMATPIEDGKRTGHRDTTSDGSVRLTPFDPSPLQEPRSGQTDSNGIWKLDEVLPGRYRLEAGAASGGDEGASPVVEQAEIRAGETARVRSEPR